MKRHKYYLLLMLVLSIFLVFGLIEVFRVEGLYSYDPYYHMHLAKYVDAQHPFATEIPAYNGEIPIQYPTSLRLLTVLIHTVSGSAYLYIYKVFGLFSIILLALSLYITIQHLIKCELCAIFSVLLFLSAPILILRSFITYPENLVLVIHVLIFYSILKIWQEKRATYFVILSLFLSSALYIHYRSFIIPISIVAIFFCWLISKKILNKDGSTNINRNLLYASSSFLLLSIPMLGLVIKQYVLYLRVNVGEDALWKPYVVGTAQYAIPEYQNSLGILLILFMLLGIAILLIRIIKKPNIISLLLLFWVTFTFLLTLGPKLEVWIPSIRMLTYFAIPTCIISSFSIKKIIGTIKGGNSISVLTFASCILLLYTLTLPTIHGSVCVGQNELDAANWINTNVSEDSIILVYNIDLITIGISKYNLIESRQDILDKIFSTPYDKINRVLPNFYTNKSIYIIAKEPIKTLGFDELTKVFEKGGIKIFYYRSKCNCLDRSFLT